ncbi:MAG: FtsQ-type POTRA domain-containing protein [Eubacteriales bacterium]|nr:FtsQ-type POTRA domain-containing protein [Eubacteriales bacterium]MDY3332149.1 FtsQ-type POTRA domain-containing protein [Gallibacter sp.]
MNRNDLSKNIIDERYHNLDAIDTDLENDSEVKRHGVNDNIFAASDDLNEEDRQFEEIDESDDDTSKKTVERYRRNKGMKKRRKKNFFLRAFLFILFLIVIFFVMKLSFFNVVKTSVTGNTLVKSEEVLKLADIKKNTNIFFCKKGDIEDRVLKNPFIEEVDIDRSLPNELIINVKERKPAFLVGYGTRYITLDDKKIVLELKEAREKITLIKGVVIKDIELGKVISVKDEGSLDKAISVINECKKADLFFKSVEVRDEELRCYIYDQLLVKGDYNDVMKSIKGGQMKEVVYSLYKDKIERGTLRISKDGEHFFSPVIDK